MERPRAGEATTHRPRSSNDLMLNKGELGSACWSASVTCGEGGQPGRIALVSVWQRVLDSRRRVNVRRPGSGSASGCRRLREGGSSWEQRGSALEGTTGRESESASDALHLLRRAQGGLRRLRGGRRTHHLQAWGSPQARSPARLPWAPRRQPTTGRRRGWRASSAPGRPSCCRPSPALQGRRPAPLLLWGTPRLLVLLVLMSAWAEQEQQERRRRRQTGQPPPWRRRRRSRQGQP